MPEIPAETDNGMNTPHESFFENNSLAFLQTKTHIKIPQIVTKEDILPFIGGDQFFARDLLEPASC